MCGRFTFTTVNEKQAEDIQRMLDKVQSGIELDRLKNGDIFSSEYTAVIVNDGPKTKTVLMK